MHATTEQQAAAENYFLACRISWKYCTWLKAFAVHMHVYSNVSKCFAKRADWFESRNGSHRRCLWMGRT